MKDIIKHIVTSLVIMWQWFLGKLGYHMCGEKEIKDSGRIQGLSLTSLLLSVNEFM